MQLDWAQQIELPAIIHSRNSLDDTISIVREMKDERLKGIFHCFNGTPEQAREIVELGFYLGIGGVLTFKNAGVDKALKDIPLQYLVLETDAPYLSPVPYRGKRNESAYLANVVEKLADVFNVEKEEIAHVTTQNAIKIFTAET